MLFLLKKKTQVLPAAEPRSPSNRSRVADAYNQMVTSPQRVVTSQGEGMEMLRKQIEQSGEFVVVRKEEVEGLKKEGKKSEKASSKVSCCVLLFLTLFKTKS